MNTADFNHNDFSDGQASEADKTLLVRFFHKTDKKKGLPANAMPEFVEVEYIEIRIPGTRDAQACRPATLADKNRFPEHYDRFVRRIEAPSEGYPLTEWSAINRTLVEALSFLNVKTVEQLANVADSNITQIMGGYDFKARAKAWIEERSSNKTLAEENEKLKTRLAELEARMNVLMPESPPEMVVGDTELESDLDKPVAKKKRKVK